MTKLPQRFLQRSQSGQSLVILAIGFVALLGFVGIVTDVSLMFVRFSSLTRAVDAASIAAAGQVRRQVPFQSEVDSECTGVDPSGNAWTRSNPCPAAEAAAFGRSFGNVGVAARQFIEFYGLDPQAVLIDMCFTVSRVNTTTQQLEAIPGLEAQFAELCQGTSGRNNERKLIQVTAQIDSPTVFLRLLGFPQITLEATSVSETAVLDVVLIMDVSESMLNLTTYETWADAGYNYVYMPPDVGWDSYWNDNGASPGNGFGPARQVAGNPEAHDFGNMTGFGDYSDPSIYDAWFNFRADLSAKTPGDANALLWNPAGTPNPFEVRVGQLSGKPSPTQPEPRTACRVAYYPYSFKFNVSSYLNTTYQDVFGERWQEPYNAWSGYVPTYNFYRCCNDPNGDGVFRDLLCQPFRSARDATEQFIQRVDFLRGDRVAFVTFDKQAYLVNVDVDPDPSNTAFSHMIDSEQIALNTLRDYIGVRAEPSFYEPMDLGGGRTAVPWVDTVASDGSFRSSQLGSHDYEVANNCPFQDASLPWPWSPVAAPNPTQATNYGFTYDPLRSPNLLTPDSFAGLPGGQRMYPRGTVFESAPGYSAFVSYDLWASCRGTNIGAALREGSNALIDPLTTRTDGSVWVMVMLSDGAAGASDPVFDSGNGLKTEPADLAYIYNDLTYRVSYGGLGVCPVGNRPNDTELSEFTESPFAFPFCSDIEPETRHFCFNPQIRAMVDGESQNLWVDLGHGSCADPKFYDVDDYARDWADWIGLAEPPGAGATAQRNLTQLPTIFTIGFGLNFANGTTRCEAGSINAGDESDCLGEELLRYIADVGDNFRIDSDYQQDLVDDRLGNVSLTNEEFGPRGECEEENLDPAGGTYNDLIDPLPAKRSCGNYYWAPDADELERVFDDITSRMFTRLTQ